MQAQKQKKKEKPTPRPRPKRTVGELVAAWLLLLWGLLSAWTFLPSPGFIAAPEIKAMAILIFAQGSFCLLAGLAALLRHRKGARWLLSFAGLSFLGLLGVNVWLCVKYDALLSYLLPIGACLIIAMGFVFLGRWLGMQEDSDD